MTADQVRALQRRGDASDFLTECRTKIMAISVGSRFVTTVTVVTYGTSAGAVIDAARRLDRDGFETRWDADEDTLYIHWS